ncbi:MAG TPA: LamG-like jellyroll fold domain-containing protein, partial [Bacteroidia bacterium]|nr:LamG-like jellyroll fold domain-containing protein [Bacteroidia bacterium]
MKNKLQQSVLVLTMAICLAFFPTAVSALNNLDKAGLATTTSMGAYSVRQLSSTYAGPAIRVHRSADAAEADVAFDATGIVSANSTVTITSAGSSTLTVGSTTSFADFYNAASVSVSIWYDQSGNGFIMTQATSFIQPIIVNAGVLNTIKGKTTINFNGANQSMAIPIASSAFNLQGSFSVVETQPALQNNFNAILSWENGSSAGPGFGPLNSAGGFGLYGTSSPSNLTLGPVSAGTTYALNATWTGQGTSITEARNGTVNASGLGTLFTQSISPGNLGADNGSYYLGSLSEVIIFTTPLSTINRQTLEQNQQAFFASSITSISPSSAGTGDLVTITGTNLSGATAVSFGGTPAASFTVVSSTTITAVVAAGSTGTVSVTTPYNTTTLTGFTYQSPPGNALVFNGTTNYVNIPVNTNLQFGTGNLTYEAWINTSVPSGANYVVLGSWDGTNGFWLGISNQVAAVVLGNLAQINGVTNIADGHWHHIAVTRYGTSVVLYVDGNAEATQTNAANVSSTLPLWIGNFSGAPTYYFPGKVDEVRMYNTDLTQAQIKSDMLSTTSSLPANLVSYYNFDMGIAGGTNTGLTTLYDQGTGGNNGTLIGFTLTGTASNWVESYALAVPTATAATNSAGVSFNANWTAPALGIVTNYLLDVSTSSTFASFVAGYNGLNVGNVTTYSVTGLTAGTTYYYRVRADKSSVTGTGDNSYTITVAGAPAAALNFNAASLNYVSVPDNANLDFGSADFTVEADIKTSVSQPNYAGIVVKAGSSTNSGYQLVLVGNKIAMEIGDGTTNLGVANGLQGTSLLDDGNWHHLSASVNRTTSTIVLSVDGNPEATVTNAVIGWVLVTNTGALQLIGVERTNTSYFTGNIDEVRIWKRSLCQGEIQNNMNCEIATTATGLVANYHFNQGTASGTNTGLTSLTDVSGNGLTGTLHAFTLTGATSNWIAPGGVTTGNTCAPFAATSFTSTTPGSRYGTGTVVLGATSSGGTINWYAAATGGASLGTGSTFTTPSIAATTTYYVDITNGTCVSASRTAVTATVSAALTDEAVTVAPDAVCGSGTATVSVAPSQGSVTYTLRNNTGNTYIAGPVSGTGSTITLPAGTVSSTTTYNVLAEGISTGTGKGLSFNGTTAYVSTASPANIPVGNSNYTIEAWVKVSAFGTYGIAGWGNYGTTNQSNALRIDATGKLVNYWWGNDLYASTPTLTNGSWHHVAATFDGTTRTIYLDGVSVTSDSPGTLHAVPNANNFTIGVTNSTEYLPGSIDEVRIWNVARTGAQLTANMNNCLMGNEAGLVSYYRMEEGAGTTTADATGNNNTGTLAGTTIPAWVAGATNTCAPITSTTLTATPTVTVRPTISNQTVAATLAGGCSGMSTTVTTASSQTNTNYYLRNNTGNAVIAGPVAGTGAGLSFNTGTISSTTTYNVYAESVTTGMSFGGTNQYIAVANTTALSSLGASTFTMEAWANPTNYAAVRSIIRKSSDYNLYFNGGKLCAEIWPTPGNTSFKTYTSSVSITAGTWTHVAAVWNGSVCTLYINGVADAGTTFTNNAAGSVDALWIGYSQSYGQDFLGSLDEVRIWNTANTATQIATNMNSCLVGTETGLLLDYKFEDGTGSSTVTDVAGGDNTGTLTNINKNTAWVNGVANCSPCSTQMAITPTITISPSPAITTSPASKIICVGANTSFTVAATGTALTYQWQVNTGSGFNNVLNAGVYSNATTATLNITAATATMNGYLYQCVVSGTCTPPAISATATLTVNSAITIALNSQTNISCNGGSHGALSVTAAGGTPAYVYSWTPGNPTGNGTNDVNNLTAGTWTCTTTDINSCSASATFTITQPTAITSSVVQSNVSCFGGSNGAATVTAGSGSPGYTYAWTPSGGTGSTASGLSAISYTCTITDALGCNKTQTATITQPTAITSSVASTNVSCFGGSNGSATVTPGGGTPGYTYAWSPSGGTAATASGLAPGTYTCTITDANACTKTQAATITQPTAITSSVVSTNVSCNGGTNGSATVTPGGGTPGYTYTWT